MDGWNYFHSPFYLFRESDKGESKLQQRSLICQKCFEAAIDALSSKSATLRPKLYIPKFFLLPTFDKAGILSFICLTSLSRPPKADEWPLGLR